MFTLGIPKHQYRRTTQVLGHENSEPIEFNAIKQDDGFYMFSFPGADEFDFKDIVKLLKSNGVTAIGADDQLTERKIMKLVDLIKEAPTLEEERNNPLLNALKRTVQSWSMKKYPDDKTKAEEFALDIEELIEDFEEQQEYNRGFYTEGKKDKIRKLIRRTIRQ